MKVCPVCNAEFDDQLKFCRQDGTALKPKPVANLCPSCGGEVGSGQKFCRHCGTSLESPKPTETLTKLETPPPVQRVPEPPTTSQQSPIELAEDYLRDAKYQEAIATLDAVVKTKPQNQEARLLQLYATIKLYNIYGYETQIDSLRSVSMLSEKEREIAREIFDLAAGEMQKRGKTEYAREYQRLATRVVLGQPLIAAVPKTPAPPTVQPKPPEAADPRVSPQVKQ